jgi:hypothetical protein
MKQFKTVSEFKKVLSVGDKLHTTFHKAFAGRDESGKPLFKDEDKGVREVSIKQTNSFALKTETTKGTQDSWCSYPKASEAKIEGDKLVIFEEDGLPVLTLSFVD